MLLLCAHNSAWNHPKCNSHELVRLLLYLQSIPRPKVQTLGLTVLVDARICSPSSSMFWGLSQLQEAVPGSVHRVLLVGKLPEEVPAGLQVLSHFGQGGDGVSPHQARVHYTFFFCS